jgi:hypothetical protein
LLRGLDERAIYKIEVVNGRLADPQTQLSGAYLMRAGLNLTLRGDYDAAAVILERM